MVFPFNRPMTTVQLFVTCLVDTFYPETGEAIVSILRRLGVEVGFPPGQACCGQPAFNAGLRSAPGDVIVPSGSCAVMLKHGYLELFAGDRLWLPRAQALAARTHEFTEYLVDVLGVTDLGARWDGKLLFIRPVPRTITWVLTVSHGPCSRLSRMPLWSIYRPPKIAADLAEYSLLNIPNSALKCSNARFPTWN